LARLIHECQGVVQPERKVDPALLKLLTEPQWQPYVVFPGEFIPAERAVGAVQAARPDELSDEDALTTPVKRPLFILLDARWPEARKMFRKRPNENMGKTRFLPIPRLRPDPQRWPYTLACPRWFIRARRVADALTSR